MHLDILVVASDPTVAGLVSAICAAEGHAVASCTTPEDARAHVAHRPADLLVVHAAARPAWSAPALLGSCVQARPGLQALLLADDPAHCALEEALAAGASNVLATPVDRAALSRELCLAASDRGRTPAHLALRRAAGEMVEGYRSAQGERETGARGPWPRLARAF